jgi:hypothetical protein
MRRAGVPQVIRMKISGHKTDSMERRYNIVDTEDLSIAKEFMERRMKAAQTTIPYPETRSERTEDSKRT